MCTPVSEAYGKFSSSAATRFGTWQAAPAVRNAPITALPRAPVPPVTTTWLPAKSTMMMTPISAGRNAAKFSNLLQRALLARKGELAGGERWCNGRRTGRGAKDAAAQGGLAGAGRRAGLRRSGADVEVGSVGG